MLYASGLYRELSDVFVKLTKTEFFVGFYPSRGLRARGVHLMRNAQNLSWPLRLSVDGKYRSVGLHFLAMFVVYWA